MILFQKTDLQTATDIDDDDPEAMDPNDIHQSTIVSNSSISASSVPARIAVDLVSPSGSTAVNGYKSVSVEAMLRHQCLTKNREMITETRALHPIR